MSTVTLTIGPKNYMIACADGEEAHIEALGAIIAEKYAQLGPARAPLEAQNMLFAALFMADELADAKRQLAAADPGRMAALEKAQASAQAEIARLKAELESANAARQEVDLFGGPDEAEISAALAQQLEQLAERAEAAASALEAGRANA